MIRKMLVVAAAIAMPVSVVAVTGGLAGASNPHTAASDSIACANLTGKLTFTPALSTKGHTSGSEKVGVSATVTGCKVTGGGVTVSKGVVSGTLTGSPGTAKSPSGTCIGLAAKSNVDVGTLKITWTGTGSPGTSTLMVKSVAGSTTGSAATGHGVFTIPGTTKSIASGSFVGTDKGGKDKSVAETAESPGNILKNCSKGIPNLVIQAEQKVTAVNLG
jgi:hypothetical protein